MRPKPGPIVAVGAHAAALFMHVSAVPKEGETVLGWGYDEPEDGGKATNQAIAAARLGAPAALVTVLGNDDRGRRARASLERAGVDTRWVVEAEGATDGGFVMLPPSRIPAIASAQDRSRDLDRRTVEAAADVIRSASIVVCQLEAPQEAAVTSFRIARAVGARTVLNPAPAADLEPELLALTDILIPNEHEAAAIVGADIPSAELAERLAADLPDLEVVVTAGGDGAYIVPCGGGTATHVPAPEVTVADTTGAGDAFIGALVTRLREGDGLVAAAGFAVRAASMSVTRPGTIPAFATAAEMEVTA